MPSIHEAFWSHASFAVVGNSAKRAFPKLTYNALKSLGKIVYPVDPGAREIEGDPTVSNLSDLPGPVEAMVLEVPKAEAAAWMTRAVEAGIREVWVHGSVHGGCETPEALEIAAENGIRVCSGTCAVQYLRGGFPHNVHRSLRKLFGRW